jgi:hypothetical protein
MLTLLERSIASVEGRLTLLAPPGPLSATFRNVDIDAARHQQLFREMQRLRGDVYLRDGAIERHELSPEGLHQTPEDEKSWHLLMLGDDGRLNSCIWYMEHENSTAIDALRAGSCWLARHAKSRDVFRRAVEAELAQARSESIRFAESGGWAVAEGNRCSSEGLVLALGAFAMGNITGGVRALATATARHCSSTILRRLGGSLLAAGGQPIASYYDPKYKCDMELLRFDSRRPNPKYAGLIDNLCQKLSDVPVIARSVYEVIAEVDTVCLQPERHQHRWAVAS